MTVAAIGNKRVDFILNKDFVSASLLPDVEHAVN